VVEGEDELQSAQREWEKITRRRVKKGFKNLI